MNIESNAHSFTFDSPEGRSLCRQLLSSTFPHDPHDYQLDGVCKALDGVDVLAITPTGSGKTGFLVLFMLVIQALSNNPALCPQAKVKNNPAMIVVCPTKSLELDMEPKFSGAGLSSVVINADTVDAARRVGRDLWTTARSDAAVILLAPEQLRSKEFETLLRDKPFQSRVVAFGIDEAHLLNTWGAEFRPLFRQIGNVRMRMVGTPVMIALTATLRCGSPTQAVCSFLGFHDRDLHLIRRSNMRYDIRFIFREMQSGARSLKIPELNWVLESRRRIIIFCTTISQGFHVAAYLWHKAKDLPDRERRIRLYNSLNWPSFNADTLTYMKADPGPQVIIATDTLAVGIDASNIDDVVMWGDIPVNSDMVLQKGGRIRDGKGKHSCVYIYLPRSAKDIALKVMANQGDPKPTTTKRNRKEVITMDISMATLILGRCKVDTINELYDNPLDEASCSCRSCEKNPPVPRPSLCNCSGCMPEDSVSETTVATPSTSIMQTISRKHKLTKAMRHRGTIRLVQFRVYIWEYADECLEGMMPSDEFLPDDIIKNILDHFAAIHDISDIITVTCDYPPLNTAGRYKALFEVAEELRVVFDKMRLDTKIAANAKRKATQARKAKEAKKARKLALLHGKRTPGGSAGTIRIRGMWSIVSVTYILILTLCAASHVIM